jgi:hypothetical protein
MDPALEQVLARSECGRLDLAAGRRASRREDPRNRALPHRKEAPDPVQLWHTAAAERSNLRERVEFAAAVVRLDLASGRGVEVTRCEGHAGAYPIATSWAMNSSNVTPRLARMYPGR